MPKISTSKLYLMKLIDKYAHQTQYLSIKLFQIVKKKCVHNFYKNGFVCKHDRSLQKIECNAENSV